jgi:hypothetical protein
MSMSDERPPKDPDPAPAPAGGLPGDCTGPLLRAVALQRPTGELVELVVILNRGDQPAHAQALLDTAAALRAVDDVAAMIPLLDEAQASQTLHTAAAQRPVDELAHLVAILNRGGLHTHAQAVLKNTATLRAMPDIAAMIPLLEDSQTANALHSAVAQRPVDELAELVGHLQSAERTAPPAEPGRWKIRR